MFVEALRPRLELSIGNDVFRIPGGDISHLQIRLFPYGFDARAVFKVHLDKGEDTLFSAFTRQDLIEAKLSVLRQHHLPSPEPQALTVKGPVTEKSLRETEQEAVQENPVLVRHYEIRFHDPAWVFWRQHFPSMLYVDKPMSEIIKGHIVKGISLEMEWQILENQRAMTFLNLGAGSGGASFHDFMMWFVRMNNGVWTYDGRNHSFRLGGQKPAPGPEATFRRRDVDQYTVHFPEIPRHTPRILNASAQNPGVEVISQDQEITGLNRDVLVRTPIAAEVDDRRTLEKNKLKLRQSEVELVLRDFPATPFFPGDAVRFGDGWSGDAFFKNKSCHVGSIFLTADAETPESDEDRSDEFTTFRTDMIVRLVSADDTFVPLRPFTAPSYPLLAEGKIVSELGETVDKTYQVYADSATSADVYTVNVPLWNQNVRIPFEPDLFTGHFYFPAFRDQRVLLALYFDHAWLERYLDWGARSRLPMDTQGNHLLFGKNIASETSMRHVYESSKPVLRIKRISGGTGNIQDTQMIQVKEGSIIFETLEEEASQTTEERFNVVPRVAAGRAQVAMENQAAISGVTAAYEGASSEITGSLNSATSRIGGELSAAEAELSGKAGEISGRIEAARSQLENSAGQFQDTADSITSELESLLDRQR